MAGPPVMFSLNPSAGPRVSLTPVSLPPRETAALHPAPVRRRHSCAAPSLPHARRSCTASPPRHRPRARSPPLARARVTLLLRRCSAALRAPKPHLCHPRAAIAVGLSPCASRPSPQYCSTSSPSHEFQARFGVLCTLDSVHTRCSRNCLLGCSSISSLFSKGMAYTLLSM